MVLDGAANERLLEDLLLQGSMGGKRNGPKILSLHFSVGVDFFARKQPGVDDRHDHDDDAGVANGARAHAQIIFRSAKNIAAHQFFANSFLDQAEDYFDRQDYRYIDGEVPGEPAEHGIARDQVTDRLVKLGGGHDDEQPFQQVEQFFRHAALPAAKHADDEQPDNHQVHPTQSRRINFHTIERSMIQLSIQYIGHISRALSAGVRKSEKFLSQAQIAAAYRPAGHAHRQLSSPANASKGSLFAF